MNIKHTSIITIIFCKNYIWCLVSKAFYEVILSTKTDRNSSLKPFIKPHFYLCTFDNSSDTTTDKSGERVLRPHYKEYRHYQHLKQKKFREKNLTSRHLTQLGEEQEYATGVY